MPTAKSPTVSITDAMTPPCHCFEPDGARIPTASSSIAWVISLLDWIDRHHGEAEKHVETARHPAFAEFQPRSAS